MKRLMPIMLVLALALVLAVVPLAAAGGKSGKSKAHGKYKFNAVGKLMAVTEAVAADETADPPVTATPAMATIWVKAGTKTVRAYRKVAEGLPMVVAENARLRLVTADGCGRVELAQLNDEQLMDAKVKVRGRISGSGAERVFTVHFLKVKAPAGYVVPTPPALTP